MNLVFPTTPTAMIAQAWGNKNPKLYPGTGRHMGIDIAVAVGNPVYAACPGVVETVNLNGAHGYGRYVIIGHGDFRTLYAHLHKVLIAEGQKVDAGLPIGESGGDPRDSDKIDGASDGAHLHFEVILPNQPDSDYVQTFLGWTVDPFLYLLKRFAQPARFSARVKAKSGVRVRSTPDATNKDNILSAYQYAQTFFVANVFDDDGSMWAKLWSLRPEYVAVTYHGDTNLQLTVLNVQKPVEHANIEKISRLDELYRMRAFLKGADEMPGDFVVLISGYLAQREKELM